MTISTIPVPAFDWPPPVRLREARKIEAFIVRGRFVLVNEIPQHRRCGCCRDGRSLRTVNAHLETRVSTNPPMYILGMMRRWRQNFRLSLNRLMNIASKPPFTQCIRQAASTRAGGKRAAWMAMLIKTFGAFGIAGLLMISVTGVFITRLKRFSSIRLVLIGKIRYITLMIFTKLLAKQ